jgi:PAS domain S-box-containing protein
MEGTQRQRHEDTPQESEKMQASKTRPTRDVLTPLAMIAIVMLIGMGMLEWVMQAMDPASILASNLTTVIFASFLATAVAYFVLRKQSNSLQTVSRLIGSHREAQAELEQRVEERTAELIGINKKLRDEMEQRRMAEETLQKAEKDLERQVKERTAELTETNQRITQEIAEIKRAQKALEESEAKFRNIFDSIEDGYYEVDLSGNLTFFNNALCEISGLPREQLMGMNNREYTSPETAKKMYQVFNKVHTTGEPASEVDWEIVRKNGTKRYVEASVSPIKDPKGQGIGFRGIVRDITERKRAEEKLKSLLYSFGKVWTK